jgi:hypothetical protein
MSELELKVDIYTIHIRHTATSTSVPSDCCNPLNMSVSVLCFSYYYSELTIFIVL